MREDRDDVILKAIKQLAAQGNRTPRWSEIKRETDLTDSKFSRGLRSLQNGGWILSESVSNKRKLYALRKYQYDLKRQASSIRTPRYHLARTMADTLRKLKDEGFTKITLAELAHQIALPPRDIEEFAYRLAPAYGLTIGWESSKKDLWENIQFHITRSGGVLGKYQIRRVLHWQRRDSTTGWLLPTYDDKKEDVDGILILRGATKLVSTAAKFGLMLKREYEGRWLKYGLFITSDRIAREDMLFIDNTLFVVKEVEQRYDGTTVSFNIAHACEAFVE